jgi:hypothetical protein
MLSADRPRWQYLNLSADHGPFIREVDVIAAQVEVVADVVACLAQLGLINLNESLSGHLSTFPFSLASLNLQRTSTGFFQVECWVLPVPMGEFSRAAAVMSHVHQGSHRCDRPSP